MADCMGCGRCEACIERSIAHEEGELRIKRWVCTGCGDRDETDRELTVCPGCDSPYVQDHFTDIRGPQKCKRPCMECQGENHHWLTITFPGCTEPGDDEYEEGLKNPLVIEAMKREGDKFEFIDYLQCKHCEACHPITEAMVDDPEFEFV